MATVSELLAGLVKDVRYLGIALILLGLLALLAPVASGAAVLVILGIILLLAGLVRAAFGWRARSAGKSPLGVKLISAGAALVRVDRTMRRLHERGAALRARLVERREAMDDR